MIFVYILFLLYASVSLQYHVPVANQYGQNLLSARDNEQDSRPNRIAVLEEPTNDIHPDQHDGLRKARLGERCGQGHKKCKAHLCCSPAGYCGMTAAHCKSPDCQIGWGTCDADKVPQGLPTKEIQRPQNGPVPYGEVIVTCKTSYTFAMTFDDGPNEFTRDLLDLLDKYKAKATFFVTGVNSGKGQIDDFSRPWGSLIQRMHYSGHQIASHTWSHQDLTAVSREQRHQQILKNEAALRNILGGFPTYMRPPYSKCDHACLRDVEQLGYHVISFNLDTADYLNDSPEKIQRSKDIVNKALSKPSPAGRPFLAIGHDIHAQTVYNLTEYILRRVNEAGYRAVTVGECLEDPRDNWYRWDYRKKSD
ncbi:chitin deacetylase, putative [Talaromyces stipitatus ATCC 10500]|uniref:Chitin deacetylase, putative n=1 Tax=Talaromyces stipitatus (strain ATCC 10500 / CBS 375.48 / QM 6759 / NRRL 1006) TaxID=441959 RepID=B8MQ64_TALSN|nr:chitin deacetylase, putative [Talaromyces stipitatus ATCC 10500]EED13133.1 chitin deacetylase, putative [Talaromyces stipitatus ATCC 10500]